MWPGQSLAEQSGPRQRQDQRVSQPCPWPRVGSVPSLGSLTVPRLQFPPWVLISEPKGSLSSRLSPIRTTKSPPPTLSPRRSGAPFTQASLVEAQFGAVRTRRAAQRPTGAARQDLVRRLDPPTPLLAQRTGARARSELLRVRTGSGRVAWRAHEAGRAAEAGVVDWVGGRRARAWQARGLRVLGGRPAGAERARAPGSPLAWQRLRRLLCFARRSETPTLSPTPRGGLGAAPGRLRRRYLRVRNGDSQAKRGARGLGKTV